MLLVGSKGLNISSLRICIGDINFYISAIYLELAACFAFVTPTNVVLKDEWHIFISQNANLLKNVFQDPYFAETINTTLRIVSSQIDSYQFCS